MERMSRSCLREKFCGRYILWPHQKVYSEAKKKKAAKCLDLYKHVKERQVNYIRLSPCKFRLRQCKELQRSSRNSRISDLRVFRDFKKKKQHWQVYLYIYYWWSLLLNSLKTASNFIVSLQNLWCLFFLKSWNILLFMMK